MYEKGASYTVPLQVLRSSLCLARDADVTFVCFEFMTHIPYTVIEIISAGLLSSYAVWACKLDTIFLHK